MKPLVSKNNLYVAGRALFGLLTLAFAVMCVVGMVKEDIFALGYISGILVVWLGWANWDLSEWHKKHKKSLGV
jgi:hypothetical protein